MRRSIAISVLLLACLAAAAPLWASCGEDERSSSSDGDSDADGDTDADTDTDTDSDTDDDCSEASKVVYVVDSDNSLYTFDPPTGEFGLIGTVDCGNLSSPFSMAVTRDAVAYVLFQNGDIFEVSTADATCTATPYVTGQSGFSVFGMGFATDSADTTAETLYIADSASLATIDGDWNVGIVGSITGDPELTGNGLGELWGFFPTATTPHVSQIDKANGSLVTTYPMADLSNSASAWAFAYWGAAFYVFYESGLDTSTNVYKVDADSGAVETYIPNSGKRIVGAGVSTCAPTSIE
jgi:hypothetical protein